MPDHTQYQYEYAANEKIRVGYIGCGGHSYRNIFPSFQYAPIELVAVCDRELSRAEHFKQIFGAQQAYADHHEMLARAKLDAVFVVCGYDAEGKPLATALAADAVRAGCHVFMEKPPAAGVRHLETLIRASEESGRFVLVGFKKMFTPAIERLKAIASSQEFGGLSSISVRYPQALPEKTQDGPTMIGFLDHIVHPGSVMHYLAGPIEDLSFRREPRTGATVTALRFKSGAIGTLHLTAGESGLSPLERVEIIGSGANAILENGIELTHYRRAPRPGYGRASSFITDESTAPLHYKPEFSLGTTDNKAIFLLGYVQEIRYFCECVKAGKAPEKSGLSDALELMKLFEAYQRPEGELVRL